MEAMKELFSVEARKKAEAERGRLFHMAVNAEQKAPATVMKSQELQKLF